MGKVLFRRQQAAEGRAMAEVSKGPGTAAYLALIIGMEARENPQQRGFPRAVRAPELERRPSRHGKAEVGEQHALIALAAQLPNR